MQCWTARKLKLFLLFQGSGSECGDMGRPDQEEEMKLRILAQRAMNEKLNEKIKVHKDSKGLYIFLYWECHNCLDA